MNEIDVFKGKKYDWSELGRWCLATWCVHFLNKSVQLWEIKNVSIICLLFYINFSPFLHETNRLELQQLDFDSYSALIQWPDESFFFSVAYSKWSITLINNMIKLQLYTFQFAFYHFWINFVILSPKSRSFLLWLTLTFN